MRTLQLVTALCVFAILPGAAFADPAQPTKEGSITVTPVAKTDRTIAGQPIVFPQKDGEVTVTTIEFPPGAILPIHKHPYPRIGYVLAGTLSITNEETHKTDVFKTGDVFVEAIDVWHHGKNLGKTPVRVLIVDTDEKGVPQTVLKK